MDEKTAQYIQQHWAWIIAIAGIAFAGIYLAINLGVAKRRTKKELRYRILLNSSVIINNADETMKVRIFYGDRQIKSLRIVHIEIRNTGALPIDKGDFEGPVTVTFPEGTEIFDPEIVDRWPNTLSASISAEANVVNLPPTLINQKEWLVIKVLTPIQTKEDVDRRYDIKVGGRGKGFSEIPEYEPPRDKYPIELLLPALFYGFMGYLTIASTGPVAPKFGFAVFFVITSLMMWFMWNHRPSQRNYRSLPGKD